MYLGKFLSRPEPPLAQGKVTGTARVGLPYLKSHLCPKKVRRTHALFRVFQGLSVSGLC